MLRKLIDWLEDLLLYLLVKLHLRKKPKSRTAVESVLDLVPIVFAVVGIMGIVGSMQLGLPELRWYQRLLFWIQRPFRKFRLVVIGY